ncbi:acyl-CoA dehydrogenase family protein [Ornithinimicrobium cavernae]|uniref:acyl-CoA dehydrogenase family protein n=1 Tax=Ornithinimicrobium cavernae TaxID=2666047 RepID=UPI000D69B2BA|nr:acyl-CoA dehydrogenase family protein [Ornithinimicrobium cavernae]
MTIAIPAFARDNDEMRTAVRSLLDRYSTPTSVRAAQEHQQQWSPEAWDKIVGGGWHAVAVSEDCDGAGIDLSDLHLVLFELGRANAPVPYRTAAVGVATYLSRVAPGDKPAQELAREVVDGTIIVPALDENDRTADTWPQLTEGAVTGRVPLVRDALAAESFLVAARTVDGLAWARVAAGADGVTLHAQPGLADEGIATLELARAHATALIPMDEAGLRAWLTLRWFAEACWLSGVMSRALELAVEHVAQREQFGRLIGSFQAVQHKLADAAIGVQSVAHLCRAAAADLDEHGLTGATPAAAAAEALEAVRHYGRVVSANTHQVLAGTGYALEHDLQLSTRRLRAGLLWGADSEAVREEILQIRYPEPEGGR